MTNANMTIEQIFAYMIEKGSYPAALLVFILGGLRQWWVWGWQYRELRADRDQWKTLALQGTSLANRAVNLADRTREKEPVTQ